MSREQGCAAEQAMAWLTYGGDVDPKDRCSLQVSLSAKVSIRGRTFARPRRNYRRCRYPPVQFQSAAGPLPGRDGAQEWAYLVSKGFNPRPDLCPAETPIGPFLRGATEVSIRGRTSARPRHPWAATAWGS